MKCLRWPAGCKYFFRKRPQRWDAIGVEEVRDDHAADTPRVEYPAKIHNLKTVEAALI
jgi:hypothetical protein